MIIACANNVKISKYYIVFEWHDVLKTCQHFQPKEILCTLGFCSNIPYVTQTHNRQYLILDLSTGILAGLCFIQLIS